MDQRRIDGTKTRAADGLLQRASNIIYRVILDPGRTLGENHHSGNKIRSGQAPDYTWKTIERERKHMKK